MRHGPAPPQPAAPCCAHPETQKASKLLSLDTLLIYHTTSMRRQNLVTATLKDIAGGYRSTLEKASGDLRGLTTVIAIMITTTAVHTTTFAQVVVVASVYTQAHKLPAPI